MLQDHISKRQKSLEEALQEMEKAFGKGAVMNLGEAA